MNPAAEPTRRIPVVHVVTDDRVLAGEGFVEAARRLLGESGPDVALHLRGPRSSARYLERLGLALDTARTGGAWLVVNDRLDVAAAVGADGVHLRADSLDVAVVRQLHSDWAVGASVHTPDEVRARRGADWLSAGTIYSSASHPGRPPEGPSGLASMIAVADAPVIAIGGITPERVREVREVGASGVAVLGGVWASDRPLSRVRDYLRAWRQAA